MGSIRPVAEIQSNAMVTSVIRAFLDNAATMVRAFLNNAAMTEKSWLGELEKTVCVN